MLEDFAQERAILEEDLARILGARAALDSLESELVASLRSLGYSWPEVAAPLGLSPQGARKRHLAVDPRSKAALRARRWVPRDPFVPERGSA